MDGTSKIARLHLCYRHGRKANWKGSLLTRSSQTTRSAYGNWRLISRGIKPERTKRALLYASNRLEGDIDFAETGGMTAASSLRPVLKGPHLSGRRG